MTIDDQRKVARLHDYDYGHGHCTLELTNILLHKHKKIDSPRFRTTSRISNQIIRMGYQ